MHHQQSITTINVKEIFQAEKNYIKRKKSTQRNK